MKTLILYGTRRGATTKTCEVISDVLTERFSHEVEVINVKNYKQVKKRESGFNNIILGSSIVSGRWVSKCLRILRSLKLQDQMLIVFVTAGGTMNKVKKYGITKAEAVQEGMERYINKYLAKYKIETFSKMVFGGSVIKKNKIRYGSWNAEDIKNRAFNIGQALATK